MTSAATPGVMNSPMDRDAGVRTIRLVEVSPDRSAPPAAPVSPAAARARRYRARKRGNDVPKRKPGPEPRSASALRTEVIALRRQNRLLAAQLADLRALRPVLDLQRQRFAFTDVGRLRTALSGSDPAQDEPALREELRLLRAEIEERHEYWPES